MESASLIFQGLRAGEDLKAGDPICLGWQVAADGLPTWWRECTADPFITAVIDAPAGEIVIVGFCPGAEGHLPSGTR